MRPAIGADAKSLSELEQASFAGDRISHASYRRLIRPGSHAVLVAIDRNGAVVGAAVILFRKGSRIARLYSLAVDSKHRAIGLGGLLLDAAENLARRDNCIEMALEARSDAARLLAWYRDHGYRGVETRPAYYADGGDAERMTRILADGRAR